jgi:hypothetical protein
MTDELLQRIADAFAGVPKPRDITKTVARALDDEWWVTERRRVNLRKEDREVRWTDLTDADIEAFADIFPFLHAEGHHFYLPAFMSYALRRYRDSDSLATDNVIYACARSHDDFALFTPEQMRCVIDFLTFCAVNVDYFDAQHAACAVDFLETRR